MQQAAKLGRSFVVLSHQNAKAADNHAGHYEDRTLLKPPTLVVDKKGKIIHACVGEDYKERAGADTVLAMVKQAGK